MSRNRKEIALVLTGMAIATVPVAAWYWNNRATSNSQVVADAQTKIEALPLSNIDAPVTPTNSSEPSIRLANFQQPPSGRPNDTLPTLPASDPSASLQEPIPQQGLRVPVASESALHVSAATVKFVNDIDIVAQADGLIMNLSVDEGSEVRKEDLLVEMDSRTADAEQKVAEQKHVAASVKAKDDSNLKFSVQQYRVSTEIYKKAKDLFERNIDSYDDYLKKELEYLKSGYQVEVSRMEKERDTAEANVALAQLAAAKVQVSLRTIKSPFDGVVVKVEKEKYDWVRAGEKILRMVSPELIRVKGIVQLVPGVTPDDLMGADAKVKIEITKGLIQEVDSKVGFVAFSSTSNQQYPIWVEITNRPGPDGRPIFRDGMKADIYIYPKKRR